MQHIFASRGADVGFSAAPAPVPADIDAGAIIMVAMTVPMFLPYFLQLYERLIRVLYISFTSMSYTETIARPSLVYNHLVRHNFRVGSSGSLFRSPFGAYFRVAGTTVHAMNAETTAWVRSISMLFRSKPVTRVTNSASKALFMRMGIVLDKRRGMSVRGKQESFVMTTSGAQVGTPLVATHVPLNTVMMIDDHIAAWFAHEDGELAVFFSGAAQDFVDRLCEDRASCNVYPAAPLSCEVATQDHMAGGEGGPSGGDLESSSGSGDGAGASGHAGHAE